MTSWGISSAPTYPVILWSSFSSIVTWLLTPLSEHSYHHLDFQRFWIPPLLFLYFSSTQIMGSNSRKIYFKAVPLIFGFLYPNKLVSFYLWYQVNRALAWLLIYALYYLLPNIDPQASNRSMIETWLLAWRKISFLR